jgi:hypothetical protein
MNQSQRKVLSVGLFLIALAWVFSILWVVDKTADPDPGIVVMLLFLAAPVLLAALYIGAGGRKDE